MAGEITRAHIDELRQKVLATIAEKKEDLDELDVNLLKESDWQVKRFLLDAKGDMKSAIKKLREAAKESKKLGGIYRLTATSFPVEFYKVGAVWRHGVDKKGSKLMFIRVNRNRKISEMLPLFKQFLAYNYSQLDKEAEKTGITVVFDLEGITLKNVDLDLLKYIINALDYFPKVVTAVYVYELATLFEYLLHMAKSWLSDDKKKLLITTDKKKITSFIDADQLPDFMGGTCKYDYKQVPAGAPTFDALAAKLQYSEKAVKKAKKHFAKHIQ